MSILVGDTNANGTVNAADVAQTKSRLGQGVDATKLPFRRERERQHQRRRYRHSETEQWHVAASIRPKSRIGRRPELVNPLAVPEFLIEIEATAVLD
jgi:hypothetical protein